MSESITKLQPDRTLYIASFSPKSAIGTIHHATPGGFTITGRFNALTDNIILEWNRDNDFEHPEIRYLPDGNFSGLTLSYDMAHTGTADIATEIFPYGDFPYLNIYADPGGGESVYPVPLANYATPVTGQTHDPATAAITLQGALSESDAVAVLFFTEAYWHTVTATDTFATVIADLAAQINDDSLTMTASAAGPTLTLTSNRLGQDANLIRGYALVVGHDSLPPTESWDQQTFRCLGGSSPAWHVELPFGSLTDKDGRSVPAGAIRKLQWSFSPPLPDSEAFAHQEMTVTFSNWQVAGAGATQLRRGYPRLRYEDDSRHVTRSGSWTRVTEQHSQGGYSASGAAGDYLELSYTFPAAHDLYLGVFQDGFSGIANVALDGAPQPNLDLYAGPYQDYRARVRIASGVAAGQHTVRITVSGAKSPASGGWNIGVDFIEALVPADWDAPAQVYSNVGFATDFDTAHSLALSPQRLVWGMHSLGVRGEVNHFLGIGQFAQRVRDGGSFPQRVYTFGGTPTPNDQIILHFGDSAIGHYIQIGDTLETIVRALAFKINELFNGIWASYSGTVLTVTVRAPSYNFTTSEEIIGAQTETIDASGSLSGGGEGVWRVDPAITPRLNLATRDWHSDFLGALAARGMSAIFTLGAELTEPPAAFAQLYPDGAPVITANQSVQTTFRPESTSYWKEVFLETASLMNSAGMAPWLQFGEVQWWYFPNAAGMAYYDSYTTAQFQAQYGRPLHVFTTNNDDPADWPEDANFVRDQLQAHVDTIQGYVLASYPAAKFEALWPMDANDPPTRRLNYHVNLPGNWTPANLETFKVEAFGYTGIEHDMSKAVTALRFPMDARGFPLARSRHLIGLFGHPWPWERVLIHARRAGLPLVNLWAYDQFCFFNLRLPLATEARRARFIG
jgi:hypothetical protein